MKILLTADGSACSDRAAKFVASTLHKQAKALRVSLLHVDLPMLDRVAAALGEETVARIHREDGERALRSARAKLKRAGVSFVERVLVGNAAASIAELASREKFDAIVMGSHGRSALSNLLLGSVTARVLAESKVPVMVIR